MHMTLTPWQVGMQTLYQSLPHTVTLVPITAAEKLLLLKALTVRVGLQMS
jgi:hypothetical protein